MTRRLLRRAAAGAVAVLALVACGKRANPVAPQVRFPQVVNDLTATARESGVELAWTPARRRVDGTRLFDAAVATLFRIDDLGAGEPRPAMGVNGRIAGYTEIARFALADPAAAALKGGRILYIDRRDLVPGRRYTYVVTTTDAHGRMSAPSARVSVAYIAPPEPPGQLRVEPGDREARLAWQAPGRLVDGTPASGPLTYEILRAPDVTSVPAAVVGRTGPGETSFVDRDLTNDHTYQYAVRATRTEGTATVTGAASSSVAVTPVKTTPPPPPSDLTAIPSRGEVRLSWRPSPAADVASYVVYRAAPAGEFSRVGSVSPPATTFVDRDVPPGRYRYAVTAQDTSVRANESTRSNEVAVTVP